MSNIQQLGVILGVIVAGVAAFEGIRRAIIMPAARFIRKFAQMLTDWVGEDARPGIDRRPGVMEQLATLREVQSEMQLEQTDMKEKLSRAVYHTGNGHEPSLREVVEKQGEVIAEIKKQVTGKETS